MLNLMTTPLTELEYVLGVALFGMAKLILGVGIVALACWVCFSFAITSAGWGILPVIAILLAVGWMISLFVIGLVLRLGPSAEVLAWGILFVIMPLSGVFTPVSSLPGPLQPIAAHPAHHAGLRRGSRPGRGPGDGMGSPRRWRPPARQWQPSLPCCSSCGCCRCSGTVGS